eukprot:710536-Prymnesium_polylepis.1
MKHLYFSSIHPTQTTPQLCTCSRDEKKKEKAEALATAIHVRKTNHGKLLRQQHLTTTGQDDHADTGDIPHRKSLAGETPQTTNTKHMTHDIARKNVSSVSLHSY